MRGRHERHHEERGIVLRKPVDHAPRVAPDLLGERDPAEIVDFREKRLAERVLREKR